MTKLAVYTSSTCPYCVLLKQFLDSKGIEYEERNISVNRDYVHDLIRLGINGVPVTVVDEDEVIVGYNPDRIMQLVANGQRT